MALMIRKIFLIKIRVTKFSRFFMIMINLFTVLIWFFIIFLILWIAIFSLKQKTFDYLGNLVSILPLIFWEFFFRLQKVLNDVKSEPKTLF